MLEHATSLDRPAADATFVLPVAGLSDGPFSVLSARRPAELAEWVALWESWPRREVFAHPGYVELFAGEGVEPLCACWKGGAKEGNVLYPFLLRRLEGEPYWTSAIGPAADLVTPYGYGGPFFWGCRDADRLQRAFWGSFEAWAQTNGVVSEFVRFSLFPEDVLPYPGSRKTDRQNVVRELALDDDALWSDFKHKVRKNVKKAQRSAVHVAIDPAGRTLTEFLDIYRQTMDRRHAGDAYRFGPAFFERIHARLPGQFAYFHAVHEGRVVSSELVLVSTENVYSFLGGTDHGAFDLRPNDLIKYEIIRWARAQGKRRFVLGGGYEPEDGIFQYKAAFAPAGIVPFQVGRRVFDPPRYEALVAAKRDHLARLGQPWQPRDDYFPAYRA